MMKSAFPLALVFMITTSIARADSPAVAVDIAPVHSLVAQVMGTLGEPGLVVTPGASPHGYSLRPSEAQTLQDADIVFWVSAGLTPWLADTMVTLAPDATHVELLELDGVTQLTMRESVLFEAHASEHADKDDHNDDSEYGDDVDHNGEHINSHAGNDEHGPDAHGDHAERDPHAWLDPSNAEIWLDAIAEQLSKADPDNSDAYSANATLGKAQLEQLKIDLNQTLDPVRDRNFIVFHDAYHYFENAFEFPASGAISISDASKPSPARIQQIHDRVADADVTCVLSEPQFNPDLVDTVLDGTDAQSHAIDPLGSHIEIGPMLYPQLLRELAQALAECV